MAKNMFVKIFTDGAARGNPEGPGGYGAVLQYIDSKGQLHEREFFAGYKNFTSGNFLLDIKKQQIIVWN